MSCSKINKSSKENKNRISDDFYRKTEESTGNQLSVQSEEYQMIIWNLFKLILCE